MTMTLMPRGRLIPVPPVDEALRFLASRGRVGRYRRDRGGRPRRSAPSSRSSREYGADEVIVVTITHDHAARRRSYELVAEAFGLGVLRAGGGRAHPSRQARRL